MTTPPENPQFEALLIYLKQTRGFDFTAYKRSSLMRRVNKRMATVGIPDYPGYQDYLEVHPEEFGELFNTILINVTQFFRDPPSWMFLASEIIPGIVAGKGPYEPIRVWSAGCASGEEAYTLAMLLAEAVGVDAFRDRVKICATDADEEALMVARQGTYAAREIQDIPSDLCERYMETNGDQTYSFRKDLRRSLIFGRHDLIQDAPISRVDLLCCRNTLMYFNAEAQARILVRFHFALNDSGFLFLGKAETLLTHSAMFLPVDMKLRVFAKAGRGPEERLATLSPTAADQTLAHVANHVRIRDAGFDADVNAKIVIDAAGSISLVNERAREMFGLTLRDVGRPLQDLEVSYRPLELRSLAEEAHKKRQPIAVRDVEWPAGKGETGWMEVTVMPLLDMVGNGLGTAFIFTDVTRQRGFQDDLQRSRRDLETAYEELQSSNEELETTNEELQSTIEELETTNEELQSTNEELETMNEELQSTNEEMETVNAELLKRSQERDRSNSFLQTILASLEFGMTVVNQELRVQAWNHKMEDLWGLRADEVLGEHLLNLDIGLPVAELRQPIRDCLADQDSPRSVQLSATNRRGKPVLCRVTCTRLLSRDDAIRGVVVAVEVDAPMEG